MEKVMVLIIGLFLSFGTLNAKETSWKINKAKLRYVLAPSKSSVNTELIRLYQDKTFEHLVYVPVRNYEKGKEDFSVVHESTVQRNTGTYSIAAGKIQFNVIEKEFTSDLYKKAFAFIDNKIYTSRFESVFQQKKFLLKTVNKSKYNYPFYLDPFSQRIVRNEGVETKIDLADLSKFLIKGGHSQWANYLTLVTFIQKQIEVDATSSIDLSEEPHADLTDKIAGKFRIVNSLQLSELIAQMGIGAGLDVKSIRGYKKQAEGKNYVQIAHAWNQVNLGKQAILSDISMNEHWLKVDPVVMIYTYLPLKEEDQLLEKPISAEDFDKLPYVQQVKDGASYISFIPSKQSLLAKGKVDVLFDEHISGLKVTFQSYDEQTMRFGTAVVVNSTSFEYLTEKTLVSIPIMSKKGQLSLQLPNGMVINYFIDNNGMEEIEVANYLKGLIQPKRPSPMIKNAQASTPILASNDANSILDLWANSSDLFLKELAALEFSDVSILQNPLIKEARKYVGVKEMEGKANNKTILSFFKETGNGSIKSDEEAWCSVFIGFCAKQAGLGYSKNATAKSWLDQGIVCVDPKPGDIVVFWREDPNSWKGHVAIYLGKDESTNEIICLGGNQDNQVCIRRYDANQVVGYRSLISVYP